jgi:hypothetical protein
MISFPTSRPVRWLRPALLRAAFPALAAGRAARVPGFRLPAFFIILSRVANLKTPENPYKAGGALSTLDFLIQMSRVCPEFCLRPLIAGFGSRLSHLPWSSQFERKTGAPTRMLDAIWAFLKHPANRDALGWIGGGIIVVVSGLWAVIKFLSKKEPGPTVQATNGSVAAGGDMAGNKIDIGGSRRSRKR